MTKNTSQANNQTITLADFLALIPNASAVEYASVTDKTTAVVVKHSDGDGNETSTKFVVDNSTSDLAQIKRADKKRKEAKTRKTNDRPAPLQIASEQARAEKTLADFDKATADLAKTADRLRKELEQAEAELKRRETADETKRKVMANKDARADFSKSLRAILVHNATKTEQGLDAMRKTRSEYCIDDATLKDLLNAYAETGKHSADAYYKEATEYCVKLVTAFSVIK